MRRTIVSIIAVLFGTALLVGLKTQPIARMGIVAGAPLQPATDTSGQPPQPSSTTSNPPPSGASFTGAPVDVRTAQSPAVKASICGACADYSVSVTLTVSGGRIVRASASYNPSPGSSQGFADRADSQLSQSILTGQTWNLGPVSRATYAGNAWELSAKDAMTRAGLKV